MTKKEFVEFVKELKTGIGEDAAEILTDDLGYVEILACLVSDDILDNFAKEDGDSPVFLNGEINWSPKEKNGGL